MENPIMEKEYDAFESYVRRDGAYKGVSGRPVGVAKEDLMVLAHR